MTLRTAARIGVAGSAMPFAGIVAWFVVASVAEQPIADMNFHWDPLSMAFNYLQPVAVFGFLAVLDRVSAGLMRPARLNDAAMAAAVVSIVVLAVNLRWSALALFPGGGGWQSGSAWLISEFAAPVGWLAFFISFVRWPAPPMSTATRRCAAWLALALSLGALWPAFHLGEALLIFWWNFPPRGNRAYFMWNDVVSGFINAARWLLLLWFALAIWRMRPKSVAVPAPASDVPA